MFALKLYQDVNIGNDVEQTKVYELIGQML